MIAYKINATSGGQSIRSRVKSIENVRRSNLFVNFAIPNLFSVCYLLQVHLIKIFRSIADPMIMTIIPKAIYTTKNYEPSDLKAIDFRSLPYL